MGKAASKSAPPAPSPSVGRQKPLGQLLKEMDLINEGQIQEALAIQRKKGGVFGDILCDLGIVSREEILLALAAQMGMELVDRCSQPAGRKPARCRRGSSARGCQLTGHL